MEKVNKTIGILGGMGPSASADLYLRIIKYSQERYNAIQDCDYPPVILISLAMSGFDETGIVNESLVKKQLIDSVKKLEIAGADFIVIACNTVHFFYKEMQEAVKIPILSIVEETKNKIIKFRFKKVGLLSSESTSKLKIYQNILDKSGIKVVSADKKQQKTLNNIIEDVMGGKQGDKDAKDIKSIIAEYVNRGAEAIVLGCTELPLAIKQSQVDIKIFNTTQIIAEAAVDFSLNKKI
jgi:aspartate racemase